MCAYWLDCLCTSLMYPLDGSSERRFARLNGDTLTKLSLCFLLSVLYIQNQGKTYLMRSNF